jgi:DNA-binding GntR family transcriptional regulator
VLAGELPSGAQLREAELSNAFGVGRHSLRAALQALVYEGLLRHEPNRGVFVPEFSSADVRDLFLLRIAIETHTARLLAERRTLIPEAISAV